MGALIERLGVDPSSLRDVLAERTRNLKLARPRQFFLSKGMTMLRWFVAAALVAGAVLSSARHNRPRAWLAGTEIGSRSNNQRMITRWVASRRGSRLQGDIAMAIFVGAPFLCLELPRTAPQASTPHIAIKLDAKLLDACVGKYEMVPDNVYGTGANATVRREGDHLVRQAFRGPLDLYPESETFYFFKKSDA
jgi:hypothetical protein